MVVKKIFEKNFDDEVHAAFLKFGRGDYQDRYLLECKKQAKKWAIKTGPEYVNFLVRTCLAELTGEVAIKGIIVSTTDLRDEIDFEIVKASNFQGVRKLAINTTVEASKILDLMKKYPRYFFALSFTGEDFVLKIKAKAPKNAKPGKDGENPKAEFGSLKTINKKLVEELFFGISADFNEARVSHRILVNGIAYPENFESLKPAEVREQSKRKGIIYRTSVVDGVEKISEANFVA